MPTEFFCLNTFRRYQYIFFIRHRWKVIKKSQNSRNQVFFITFPWWWEDPDPDPHLWLKDPDPGGSKASGSRSGTLLFLRSFIRTNLVLVLNQIDPCCVVPVGNLHFNHIDLVLTAALLWVKRWHVISLFESSPPLSLTHKFLVQHLKWGSEKLVL